MSTSSSTYPKWAFRILPLLLLLSFSGAVFSQKPNIKPSVKIPVKRDIPKANSGGQNGSQQGAGGAPAQSEKKDSGIVESDKFFVANGIDGEFKTAEEACKAFGNVKFPGYTLVKCTTALNGSVYYKFTKGNQIAEQQGQVWFKIRCPDYAYQISTDGTGNWKKQECKCFQGYHPEGKFCIKDTVKTCLGELIETYGTYKAPLVKLRFESILWDSNCVVLRAKKIETEKFLVAIEKKTSKQDTNMLLCKYYNHIDTAVLYSWQVIYKATESKQSTGLTSDFPLISAVRNIKYGKYYDALGGDKELQLYIEANKRANCKSCDIKGKAELDPIDEYLEDLEYFVKEYNDKQVLATSKRTGNPEEVEGTAFMYRVLHDHQSAVFGADITFEGSIDDAEKDGEEKNSNCRYDIRTGTPGNYYYFEFKSRVYNTQPNGLEKMSNQFLTYLKAIESYNNLRYIFDARKISQTDATKQMIAMFKLKFDKWYEEIPPEKWAKLFNCPENKQAVKDAVLDPNNIFYYNVVKVY